MTLKITGATVNPNSICIIVHTVCGGTISATGYHNRPGGCWENDERIAFYLDPKRPLTAYQDLCTCPPRCCTKPRQP